jgi:hypothetical protein
VKTWTAMMADGWTWTVRARTEDEAREKVAELDRRNLGRIRTPTELTRR